MFKEDTFFRSSPLAVAVAGALLAAAPAAHAVDVAWTDWTAVSIPGNSANGVIAPSAGPAINVTLSGPNAGGSTTNTFPFGPAATYIGGIVSNAPCTGVALCNGDLINIPGATPGANTLTFSSAVTDPVFAVWSLGDATNTASLTLPAGTAPVIQSTGPNAGAGFVSLTASGNVVSGQGGQRHLPVAGHVHVDHVHARQPGSERVRGLHGGSGGADSRAGHLRIARRRTWSRRRDGATSRATVSRP